MRYRRLRFLSVAPVLASALVSAVGLVALPADARVLRHSSGTTWSRDVALVAYPLLVAVLAGIASVADRLGDDRRLLGMAVTWAVVLVQVALFIAAA